MLYNILIADDEILVRKMMIEKLCSKKLNINRILEADNGETAIELFEKYNPEIVIVDIKMPKKDGLEVAKYIRNLSPETQIIILSGYASFEYAQTAVKLLVNDYILKPAKISELENAILKAEENYEKSIQINKTNNLNEKTLTDILNGIKRCGSGILYDACQVRIAVFSIDEIKDLTWDIIADHYLICYAIINILKEVVNVANNYFVKDNFGNIVLILCKDFLNEDELNRYINELKMIVEKSVGITVLYNISDVCTNDDELRSAYIQTLSSIKNSDMQNFNEFSEIVRKARAYVEENICNEISLSKVSDYVHMTPTYFSALYKRETGDNFSKYVSDVKIEFAKKMLTDQRMKVYEVADKLGFESAGYFGQFFKKHVKMTIAEYLAFHENRSRKKSEKN